MHDSRRKEIQHPGDESDDDDDYGDCDDCEEYGKDDEAGEDDENHGWEEMDSCCCWLLRLLPCFQGCHRF